MAALTAGRDSPTLAIRVSLRRLGSAVGGDVSVYDTQTFSGTPLAGSLVSFFGSFSYDPSQGDLLVDIVRVAGLGQGIALEAGLNSGVLDRAYAFVGTTAADIDNRDGYGDLTRLGLAEAPEPAAVALPAAGLAGIGARRR